MKHDKPRVPFISLLLGVLVVLLFTIPGCPGGGSSNDGLNPDGSKQTVRYGAISSKIRGLDPMDIGDTTSSGIASNFYDTLYQYHYLKRPYVIIPSVAADLPEVSEDGLTLTIKLRDDVYFHDDEAFPGGKGRKVVAADFVYSWKRLANIKNVSKNWWIFDGRIAGLNEFREYTKTVDKADVDYDRPVEGLKALDESTLQITLTKPWPQKLYMLSHLPTAVVPREAVEKYNEEFANTAVGTGPFMLDSWRRGSKITMVRNPTFREEFYPSEGEPGDQEAGLLADAGKRLPLLDRAEFSIVEEDLPYWLLFMDGKTDRAGIPKDNYDMAITADKTLTKEMIDKGIVLQRYEDPATFWFGFNMEGDLIGKNKPLRQAMNLAINREEYLEIFLNNRGVPAKGVLPPMFEDYNQSLNSPYTTYDVEKAKALVKEAEKLNGGPIPKLTLTMGSTDSTAREMGGYITDAMNAIGLEFEVDFMDWPTAQEQVKRKLAMMYVMGWMADIPDSENFLQLFYGPNGSPGANNMNYQNDRFDELYQQIKVMEASPERTKLVQEMEQIVVDDLPAIFTVHRTAFVLQYDWLKNTKPHVFGYGLMKYTDIDTELRDQRLGR